MISVHEETIDYELKTHTKELLPLRDFALTRQ